MKTLTAQRVRSGGRGGSSRPVVADTEDGPRLVKLRGAAQGTGPLVAEIVVGALAEQLGLCVPARALVTLLRDTPSDDRDAELADLLAASAGLNLGFEILAGAREPGPSELTRLDPLATATILWLDRFVLNPDRTSRNPNLLWWRGRPWLIDHGAALWFQYDWSRVTEDAPRAAGAAPEPHLFESAAASRDWPCLDAMLAGCLTRAALEDAVADVPADFLRPLLPESIDAASPAVVEDSLCRRRAAYVAFLWKRLREPRAFAG